MFWGSLLCPLCWAQYQHYQKRNSMGKTSFLLSSAAPKNIRRTPGANPSPQGNLGLSENRLYSQWNSHLTGIMISKTIGFRGTRHFQTHPPAIGSSLKVMSGYGPPPGAVPPVSWRSFEPSLSLCHSSSRRRRTLQSPGVLTRYNMIQP